MATTQLTMNAKRLITRMEQMRKHGIWLTRDPHDIDGTGFAFKPRSATRDFAEVLLMANRTKGELSMIMHRQYCRACLETPLAEHERQGEPICLDCVIAGRAIPDVVRWVIRDDPRDRSR